MKRNVNVFIAVLLCAVLCGGIVWLQTANDEKVGWNINDNYGKAPIYSSGAAYTDATFAGSSNDGGVMPMSSSGMLSRRPASSYAGAHAVSYGVSPALSSASLPSLQGGAGGRLSSSASASASAGGGLYTTSSKMFNSYGGGGNGGAAGGAMRGGALQSSAISYGGGGSMALVSPISYSSLRKNGTTLSNGTANQQDNPVTAASAMNGSYSNMYNGAMSGSLDYASSLQYGAYTGMFGSATRSNVRGRLNADGFGDAWWVWFNNWATTNGDGYSDGSGNYYFDEGTLREVYQDFIDSYWNSGMGDEPLFEDWLDWYKEYTSDGYYGYNGNNYYWGSLTPVGDIVPLLLLAFLYVVAMYLRSKFRAQVND